MEENNTNKSSIILNIISSNGNNKELWVKLLSDIYTGEININDDIILSLKDFLTKKANAEICLDIIHFLVDYGTPNIVEQIAKKDFLQIILELLKKSSDNSIEVQKKVIFLTKIWAKKFENEKNQNYLTFIDNYNTLMKENIIFPPDYFKLETYTKYISNEEANNAIMKAKNMKEKNNNDEDEFSNPFISEMGDQNNIVNEQILDDQKMNNENKENPHKLNNNFNFEKNNFNSNCNNNNNNNRNNNDNNNNNNNININFNVNENDNDYFSFGNSSNNEENQKNEMEMYERKTRYPDLPNQCEDNNNMNRNFINRNNMNRNNVNRNNVNRNNNNFNNNYNQNDNNLVSNNNRRNNTYDNVNNNSNINPNQNCNYSNNIGINNYNNQNYNINNNYNSNSNNNNYNINNYNNSSNCNNNNGPNNYSNNNYNDTFDIISFKQTLGNKLLQLNAYIDEGKFSFNSGKLKQGIIEIINEILKCEYMMNRCQLNKDRKGYEIVRNMKMDIEQTCSRYENLMKDRRVEPFCSSFSGNHKQYYFDKSALLGSQENNLTMNNFNEYYKNQPDFCYTGIIPGQNSNYKKESTIEDRLIDYGSKVKDGLFFVGGKIKDTAISGFNFVKEKFNDDGKDNNSNNYL